MITYSATATALASNIQAALAALTTIGTGGTLVSAASATSVTITFQNWLGGAAEPAMSVPSSNLTGGTVSAPAPTLGGVVSGPLGVGTFYLFGNAPCQSARKPVDTTNWGGRFTGTTGTNNGGVIEVASINSPQSGLATPLVTLHNAINLIDSNFEMAGSLFGGGANLNLAGRQ